MARKSKVVEEAVVEQEAVEVVAASVCGECAGRGLKDADTLCSACEGHGK
jgi:DnaJ-class molecular chaperone